MATIQKFLPFDVSSDANFDAIGAGIYDAIVTTMGWVEKADTGRTDWSTNPARPGAGSYLWNVFGPNDALQTGGTIYYVKLEIGLSSTSTPRIRVSIGTGTDGAGTLTGTLGATFTLPYAVVANQGATTHECNFSGDVGRMAMMLWRTGSSECPMAIAIERTLSTAGSESSDGVFAIMVANPITNYSRAQHQTLVFGVGAAPLGNICTVTDVGTYPYSPQNSNAFNNSVPLGPVFPSYGKFGNPTTLVATCRSADAPEGGIVECTLYGATRYYMASGAGPFDAVANTASKLLMRWD